MLEMSLIAQKLHQKSFNLKNRILKIGKVLEIRFAKKPEGVLNAPSPNIVCNNCDTHIRLSFRMIQIYQNLVTQRVFFMINNWKGKEIIFIRKNQIKTSFEKTLKRFFLISPLIFLKNY